MTVEIPDKFLVLIEGQEIKRAMKSLDLSLVLWDFKQYIRNLNKSGIETISVNDFSEKFNNIMESHNINLDELIS